MTTTRRNAVKFLAGSAVGVMFTPAPWRMVRDSALWSESWPGVPEPKAGPVTYKIGTCGLCPGGCAVKARCVADRVVSIAGVDGGLCPLGVTAHHLPFHPRRLTSGPVAEARTAVEEALGRGARQAVLDLRPGRAASAAYRKAMTERKGFYMAPPVRGATVDLTAVKTVISLGAPLLDGWLPPAKVWAARSGFRLVQIEPEFSRTAALADEWMPACADVAALARRSAGPVAVIDPAMSPAAMALNRELASKAIVPVDLPAPDAVPDGAVGVLYIDESAPGEYVPWPEIEPKLAPGAVVVALTWWRDGYARHTRWALPTAVWPEPEWMKAPAAVVNAAEFIAGLKVEDGAAARRPGGMCGASTPLFTKLYRESGLLLAPGQVALHPSSGLETKDRAYLESARGRVAVEVVLDRGIPPGKFDYAATPEVLDLGTAGLKVVRA